MANNKGIDFCSNVFIFSDSQQCNDFFSPLFSPAFAVFCPALIAAKLSHLLLLVLNL